MHKRLWLPCTVILACLMVSLPQIVEAQTTSAVRHNIATTYFGYCPFPTVHTSGDHRYVDGNDQIEHYISCPNGTQVMLDTAWVPWQYTSACTAYDENGWIRPDCDGNVAGYTEDNGDRWLAHLNVISKERRYYASEWTCVTLYPQYWGPYTFFKRTSDDVLECQGGQ